MPIRSRTMSPGDFHNPASMFEAPEVVQKLELPHSPGNSIARSRSATDSNPSFIFNNIAVKSPSLLSISQRRLLSTEELLPPIKPFALSSRVRSESSGSDGSSGVPGLKDVLKVNILQPEFWLENVTDFG